MSDVQSAPDIIPHGEGYSVRAEGVCGVTVLRSEVPSALGFFSVYVRQDAGTRELHLVRFTPDGARVFDRTLQTSTDARLCVSRRSLSLVPFETRQVLLVAWREARAVFGVPRGALYDLDGALRGTLVLDTLEPDVRPLVAENFGVFSSDHDVSIVYDGSIGPTRVLRLRRFDLSRPGATTGDVVQFDPVLNDATELGAVPDGALVIGARTVALTRRRDGERSLSVLSYDPSGFASDLTDIPGGLLDPIPLSLGLYGDTPLVYRGGGREQTVRSVGLGPGAQPPRTVATDTAWNLTDADADPGDALDLWVSHGRTGGSNDRVILAPPTEPNPDRCTVLRGSSERSVFRLVARARLAGQQRLIAAIETRQTATGDDGEALHYRTLTAEENPCAGSP